SILYLKLGLEPVFPLFPQSALSSSGLFGFDGSMEIIMKLSREARMMKVVTIDKAKGAEAYVEAVVSTSFSSSRTYDPIIENLSSFQIPPSFPTDDVISLNNTIRSLNLEKCDSGCRKRRQATGIALHGTQTKRRKRRPGN